MSCTQYATEFDEEMLPFVIMTHYLENTGMVID
jgi:hypothetical protein